MNYLTSKRAVHAIPSVLPIMLAMSLSACGGGMVGTGTGPTTEVYKLENLPERISPDIPKTLLKGEEHTTEMPDKLDIVENEIYLSPRNDDSDSDEAEGWEELNFELNLVDYTRVLVQSNTTIIDLAFDDILVECAEQLLDCTIPGDRIRVKITQDVVNRLIRIHTEWAESVSSFFSMAEERTELIESINTTFTSLLNKEVVLGETQYSQFDGAPYDHSVRTFLKRGSDQSDEFSLVRWRDEAFNARWNDNGNVARFSASASDVPNYEFFYQNNAPGELVTTSFIPVDAENTLKRTYAKVIGNDPDKAGILLELVSVSDVFSDSSVSPEDEVVPVSEAGAEAVTVSEPATPPLAADTPSTTSSSPSGLAYDFFQGQIDNSGGYASYDSRHFDSVDADNLVFYAGFRESFDRIGTLVAGERCFFDAAISVSRNCDEEVFEAYGPEGAMITDSVHYFKPGEFDSLAAIQDVIRWKSEGVPATIKGIAVVSADAALELAERELLCRGLQFVPGDVRIFCSATDEQLDNTLVVELVNGKPGRIIPTANLVQIQ